MDNYFKDPLGVIEQVDQKQQTAYQSIANMLKAQRSASSEQNTQTKILKDLDNFHKYYNQKCQQYKDSYDRINQQNWDYAAKLVKYQKALEDYQFMYLQAKQQLIFMDDKIKSMQSQLQRQIQQLSYLVNQKDQQINGLKCQLEKSSIKIQAPIKRKVIKLKQKSIRSEQQDLNNIQSARSYRHMNNLKNQLQQHAFEIQQLGRQNDILRKKVKHLQADRKYEQQRLKSATLSLQLDLKIKKQQIDRLNTQIQVYQKKFQQLINSLRSNHICPMVKQQQIFSAHSVERNVLSPRNYDSQQNIENNQNISQEKQTQKTHRKLDMQNTERTHKKTHKRHGSSNLEQNRLQNQKQQFNMKIKIYRFKNKKYP